MSGNLIIKIIKFSHFLDLSSLVREFYLRLKELMHVFPFHLLPSLGELKQEEIANKFLCFLLQLRPHLQFQKDLSCSYLTVLHTKRIGNHNEHDGDDKRAPNGDKEDDDPAEGCLRVVVSITNSGGSDEYQP